MGDGSTSTEELACKVTGSYDQFGQPFGSNEGEEGKGVIGKGDTCNFICNFGEVVGVVEGNGIHAMQVSNQDTAVLLHYP
jgi:hypothetical protein